MNHRFNVSSEASSDDVDTQHEILIGKATGRNRVNRFVVFGNDDRCKFVFWFLAFMKNSKRLFVFSPQTNKESSRSDY